MIIDLEQKQYFFTLYNIAVLLRCGTMFIVFLLISFVFVSIYRVDFFLFFFGFERTWLNNLSM